MSRCLLRKRKYYTQQDLSEDIERAQTRLRNQKLQRESLVMAVNNLEAGTDGQPPVRRQIDTLKKEIGSLDDSIVEEERQIEYLQKRIITTPLPQSQVL